MCVCVSTRAHTCVHTHALANVWSEDVFQDLVLSYHVGLDSSPQGQQQLTLLAEMSGQPQNYFEDQVMWSVGSFK